MRILGRKLVLFDFTSGAPKPYGAATGCTLDVLTDTVETAGSSSRAKSLIPGRYSWTMSVEALYDVADDGTDFQTRLLRAQLSGTKLRMRMAESFNALPLEPTREHIEYEGEVYVTSFSINAPVGGYANARVTLSGTGDLIIDQAQQTAL
jgi:hypothetical protein